MAASPEIRVRLIDGKPCARCTFVSGGRSVAGNAVLSLGQPVALVLHARTGEMLGLGAEAAVTIEFPDARLADLPTHVASVRMLEALSRDHAAELEEIPAVAVLGLPAFEGYRPQLNLDAGVLRLLPVQAPAGENASPAAGNERRFVVPLRAERNGYWLEARAPDDVTLTVLLSTAQHDTVIDETTAALFDAAGGQLASLYLGPLDITQFVALRPEDLMSSAARPRLVLGTNLLASFRLTIDLAARQLEFERVREPRFPAEERAFFVARASDDLEALETWLAEHLSTRLADEAGNLLLTRRLEEPASGRDALDRAIELYGQAAPPARRAERLVGVASGILDGGREDRYALASKALETGLQYVAQDTNARAVHDIHARQGQIALRQGDLHAARRYLLSAAFGVPQDPLVNICLAELYEKLGKPARAWSRYAQALAGDPSSSDAQRGLDRLNRDPAFRAEFTMTDAEQLLEGRVPAFHPAERYRPADGEEPPTTPCLLELFTSVDNPTTAAAELAAHGLQEYLGGARLAVVQYHCDAPDTDPLATEVSAARAVYYAVTQTPLAQFNGARGIDRGGDESRAADVYEMYKLAWELAASDEPAWRIGGQATQAGDEVRVEIELSGPEASESLGLFAVLCERAVMLPGGNTIVLHGGVARCALSPHAGFDVPAAAGRRTFHAELKRDELCAALEQTIRRTEEAQGIAFRMRPTYVDLGACDVVVFVQERESKQVLSTGVLGVEPAGASRR